MTPQPNHPSTTTTMTIPDVTFTRASLASHVKSTENTCAMACDGIVFDTTSGRDFYGPGGPYAALNGRDATRALATMKINVSEETWRTYPMEHSVHPAEISDIGAWLAERLS